MSESYKLRRTAQALVGPNVLAYVLHLRPMEWPIMTAHFLLGTLLAVGWALPWKTLGFGWFLFIVLLNGGTLAINSAFDQDEGDVGYLKQPPKPPKYLLHVSLAMLLASLALAFLLPGVFAWCNACCVVMSILYSVPPVRLKARAGWDMLINCLGFGALTPLAGWGLTGRPLTSGILVICGGFACLFGALYPLTQIYQIEEDRARGDKTLVIKLGEARSLLLSFLLMLAAHLAFWAGVNINRHSPFGLLVSLAVWVVVLLPWMQNWRQWSAKKHEQGMYRALAAWAVTDLAVIAGMWPR